MFRKFLQNRWRIFELKIEHIFGELFSGEEIFVRTAFSCQKKLSLAKKCRSILTDRTKISNLVKRIEQWSLSSRKEFFCPEYDLLVLKHYAPSGDTVEIFSGEEFLAERWFAPRFAVWANPSEPSSARNSSSKKTSPENVFPKKPLPKSVLPPASMKVESIWVRHSRT